MLNNCSCPFVSILVWVQTVCLDYQEMTKVAACVTGRVVLISIPTSGGWDFSTPRDTSNERREGWNINRPWAFDRSPESQRPDSWFGGNGAVCIRVYSSDTESQGLLNIRFKFGQGQRIWTSPQGLVKTFACILYVSFPLI